MQRNSNAWQNQLPAWNTQKVAKVAVKGSDGFDYSAVTSLMLPRKRLTAAAVECAVPPSQPLDTECTGCFVGKPEKKIVLRGKFTSIVSICEERKHLETLTSI